MNRDDTFVREQALNTQYSVIVRAPAGSGKTELLVSRYFKCLLNVPHPEMAVVLTFTQKAASELQERISYLIQNPSKAKTETMLKLAHAARHHADQLGWQLDRFPEILQIMTLDAYFLKIYQKFCQNAPDGLSPYVLDQNRMMENMIGDLLEHVLKTDPLCQHIAQPLKIVFEKSFWNMSHVRNVLMAIFQCRDRWQAAAHASFVNSWQDFFKDELESCQNLFSDLQTDLQSFVDFVQQYRTDLPQHLTIFEKYRLYASALMTQAGKWRKIFKKDQGIVPVAELHPWHCAADRDHAINLLKEMQQRLEHAVALKSFLALIQNDCFINQHSAQSQSAHFDAIMKLLIAWNSLWKTQEKVCDFTDISSHIMQLCDLNHPMHSALEVYWATNVRHVFLDEAQDLSFAQAQIFLHLIHTLSENNGSFFVVGDPQQAIYAFRGSDIGIFQLFEALTTSLQNVILCTLRMNFRSDPKIVRLVNEYSLAEFGNIPSTAIGVDAAVIAESRSTEEYANIHYYSYESIEQEAYHIAWSIAQEYENKKNEKWTIAVLARDRKTLIPIRKWLTYFQTPYLATELDMLAQQPLFVDLLTLIQVVLEPQVRSHWLGFLRSRWIRASFIAIEEFYTAPDEMNFWETVAALSPHSKNFLMKSDLDIFCEHYKLVKNYQMRVSIQDTIRRYIAGLEIDKTFSAFEHSIYNLVLEQLADWSWYSLYDWDALVAWADRTPTPIAYHSTKLCNIVLLTIHKSKGLEFDHVFLPNIGAKLPPKERSVWTFVRSNFKVIQHSSLETDLESANLFEALSLIDRSQSKYEVSRLLYVALTRAKHSLTCSQNNDKLDENSLASRVNTVLPPLINQPIRILPKITKELAQKTPLQLPAPRMLNRIAWNEDPIAFTFPYQDEEMMRVIGLIMHDIFARATSWPIKYEDWTAKKWHNLWRKYGGDLKLEKTAMNWWGSCFMRILKCPFLKNQVFSHTHLAVWRELEICTRRGKNALQIYRLDRCIQKSDGTYWIIDWKTSMNALAPENIQKTYKQLKNYQSILSAGKKAPVDFGIYVFAVAKYFDAKELEKMTLEAHSSST